MVYDIAGLRVDIKNKLNFTTRFCKDYLSDDQISDCDISVEVENDEFYAEKKLSPQFSDGYIENICLYRKICNVMPTFDRFLFHSCVMEYQGKCYAFTGKSGAGKSTHSGLWTKYSDAVVLNGDKPILQRTKDGFVAYGTPWQGKEGLGHKGKGLIKAICFIEQSKTNEIRELTPAETSERLFTQILLPDDPNMVMKTMELVDVFISSVRSYVLKCDISEEAFKTSFNVMTKEN